MKVTIKDIAELSGVSAGTVDRVLNARPYVKADVRERVLKIASELNYTPNKNAKALVSINKQITLGVINSVKIKPFYEEILKGIETADSELKGFGVNLILKTVDNVDPKECIQALDEMLERKVDGIALSIMNNLAVVNKVNQIVELGIPVVTFNSDLPNSSRLCFVGQDLYKSGQVAASLMERCVDYNGKILVSVGNYEFEAQKARVLGFIDRLKEIRKNLSIVDIVESFEDYQKTYDVILSNLKKHPDIQGIYMASEDVQGCVDAVKKFYESHKDREIHIICNDLLPYTRELFAKGNIDFTICQDPFMQGYKPVYILFEYLFDKKIPENKVQFTDISIYIRESI